MSDSCDSPSEPCGSGKLTRRRLLQLGAGAVAGATAVSRTASAKQSNINNRGGAGSPKRIIFMVVDGMSPGVPALAEAFSQLVRGSQTNWVKLARSESITQGWFDMASLNSLVTDSAAAASAWASGSRINNWALNTLPDGRPLMPIGALAKQAGTRVGLVTTTRATHATPAAFVASVPTRNLEAEIAIQFLDSADIVLGGGARFFEKLARGDQRDLPAEFSQHQYHVVRSRRELLNLNAPEKVLGLFDGDHLPYLIDRRREEAIANAVPTLSEMTRIALQSLNARGHSFLLQIEGGRVDHSAHVNDAAAMLWEQLDFDDAIGEVIQFVQHQPDTLVVITTDHGCGNPGLNGMGSLYQTSTQHFERIASSTKSFATMHAELEAARLATASRQVDAVAVAHVVHQGTGHEMSEAHAALVADVLNGKPAPEISLLQSDVSGIIGQILSNYHGISWTSVSHTSDWAPVLAFGAGRERFHGLLRNTDAFTHMAELLGIEHRNPVAGTNHPGDGAR